MLKPSSHQGFRPYLISLAIFAGCLGILYTLPMLQNRGAGPILMGAVFLATWLCGWRAGLLQAFLVIAVGFYLTIDKALPEQHRDTMNADDWLRMGIFSVSILMIVALQASRTKAIRASQLSENRLRAALDAARMGAWDKDLKNGAFWWSPGLEEIFGRRPGSFVASYDDFLGYIHPDDRSFVANAFTRSVESGTEFEIEHRIVRPDSGVRWIITRGQILHDEQGRAQRLLGVAVDVTDRHNAADLNPADSMAPHIAVRGRL